MSGERLKPDEDAALRRLHWFENLGCELSSALRTLKDGFRSRDRRAFIRDPFQTFDRTGVESAAAAGPKAKTEQQKPADPPGYWVQPKR